MEEKQAKTTGLNSFTTNHIMNDMKMMVEVSIQKNEVIQIQVFLQMLTQLWEKSFTHQELIKITNFFGVFDNVMEVYEFLKATFDKKKFTLEQVESMMIVKIEAEISQIKKIISLQLNQKQMKLEDQVKQLQTTIVRLYQDHKPKWNPSKIIKDGEVLLLQNWISETTQSQDVKLSLIYQGSRDGYQAKNFHLKCDQVARTLTVIKSTTKNRFGGYTELPWDQSQTYKTNDKCAFIYSLDQEKKYACVNQNQVIYCHPTYLATFGGGHDIHICENCSTAGGSYCNFPHGYGTGLGIQATSPQYIAGSYNFLVQEIEVYKVDYQKK